MHTRCLTIFPLETRVVVNCVRCWKWTVKIPDRSSAWSFWEVLVVGRDTEIRAREAAKESLILGAVVNSKHASLAVTTAPRPSLNSLDAVMRMQESPPRKRFLVGCSSPFHAINRTPHGALRLVQTMSTWSVKTRRAPSRHRRDARAYGHTP